MAIFHCSIKTISRSGGRSAVASAAYRSGEKLYDEEIGEYSDFTRKGGVVYSEILLPENAPDRLQDRETLWNEVQKTEKRKDARLCREVEIALPKEWNREQEIEYTKKYCQENFVNRGMIADIAIHDKGDGNPHAHILLTVRGFTEKREWEIKGKSVFANSRDEQGRAIYDPALPSYDPKNKEETEKYRIPKLDKDGNQVVRVRSRTNENGETYESKEYSWERVNVPANDWNDRARVEEWRAAWEEIANSHLEPEQHIDHRSYKRQAEALREQGVEDVIERVPTIHEGVSARKMEKVGFISERVEINRQAAEINRQVEQQRTILQTLRDGILRLTEWIRRKARELYERIKRVTERGRRLNVEVERSPGLSRDAAGYHREPEGADQGSFGSERTAESISDQVERRERDIKQTEQGVAGLKEELISGKAAAHERLQRLRERSQDGGADRQPEIVQGRNRSYPGYNPAGSGPESGKSEAEQRDTEALIRKVDARVEARESELAAEHEAAKRAAEREREALKRRQRLKGPHL